jgi:PE-PPE domain
MTTVLTLPGAFSLGNMTTVQAAFGGPQALLTQLGDDSEANVVGVVYNDSDPIGGYVDGANKLNAKLTALPASERIVVVGHSYGAVAICEWLRLYAASSQIDPALITFVNAANSIRLDNGLSMMMGMYGPGGGPVSTEFTVIDVARQFDKWADYPNNAASPDYWQAVNNCNYGDMVTGTNNGVPNNIHNSYQDVQIGAPCAQATIGTVTFMLFETKPPPNPSGVTRAQLETAYNRIVTPTW